MGNKIIWISSVLLVMVLFQSSAAPVLTKEEMLEEIKYDLETYEEIQDKLPEIKKHKGANGKESYTCLKDAQEISLEDLDEDELNGLLYKVRDAFWASMVARQSEQTEAARESQRVSAMQQQMPRTPPPSAPRPPEPPPRPSKQ
jgi:hypothetical protein